MIWLIVSFPFWLVGVVLFVVTTAAIIKSVQKRSRDLGMFLAIAFMLWIISGGILVLAAKVSGLS